MKINGAITICATGFVRKGKMALYMSEANALAAKYEGARVIARFDIVGPGCSEAQLGYYFNYIVPTLREAMYESGNYVTEEDAERQLRELSPVTKKTICRNGSYEVELLKVTELDQRAMSRHIEFIKWFAAENFNVYIEDPKTL